MDIDDPIYGCLAHDVHIITLPVLVVSVDVEGIKHESATSANQKDG